MKQKRFNIEQFVTLLRQVGFEIANGKSTPPPCKEARIEALRGNLLYR